MSDDDIVRPGYYGRRHDGRLVPIANPPRPPDAVVCRRVADFPRGRPPAIARICPCADCQAPIAYNPQSSRPYPDGTPRVCMQCRGIVPDPL